jgi:hypothetical protein
MLSKEQKEEKFSFLFLKHIQYYYGYSSNNFQSKLGVNSLVKKRHSSDPKLL